MTVMNNAPVLAIALPNQSSAEDETVSFALPANAFTDMDGDVLTLSATLADGTALPDWLVFDAAAGSFSGTPPQDFNGTVNVMVTASDGSLSASSSFVLDVTPVNDAPVAADDTVDPSEFLVNEFTNNEQKNPSVTALSNGHFVVTWQSDDGQQGDTSGSAIKARILNENGVEIVSEFLVNESTNGSQQTPSVTELANGHFVVTWSSNGQQQGHPSGFDIKARIFDTDGNEIVSQFPVNEVTNDAQLNPSVTALANGHFVVTWHSWDKQQGDTSSSAIKARTFDANGYEIVSEFLVNEYTNDSQLYSSVTALTNGHFVVTWHSWDQQQGDPFWSAVKARIFNENGDEIVSEFRVNEFTDWWQENPSVTALANGGFVVTWASLDQQQGDTDFAAIKARIFNENGAEIVSEFVVNEYTNDWQVYPSITALTNGNFVVTWLSQDGQQGDTDGSAIKARIFDANGDEIVNEFLVNEFTNSWQDDPSVTALANGGFVVTWASNDGQQGDTSDYAIKARVFDANGVAQSHKIITEDVVTSIDIATLLANDIDVDGDVLTIEAVDATSAHGATLMLNTDDGTISYDPTGADAVQALAEGQTLTDTFTYTVKDGNGGESTASVSVVVHGANDAPVVAIVLPDQSSEEDEPVSFVLPANAFTDVDGDALTFSATLTDGTALPDWLVFDAVAGSFSGTPPQDFNGIVNVMVTASDGSLSASSAFALDITPVNDAPVAVNDVAQSPAPITEDVVTSIDIATLLANDIDVDGDALTMLTVNAKSTHDAVLRLNNDGTISYDPTGAADVQALAEGQTLIDTFSYATDDGNGGVGVATVSIIVHGTNDAPVVALVLPDQASAEDEAVSFVLPANAFTDVDGDALTLSATLVGGAALPDWLVFDAASGSFSGTPPQDYTGQVSVTVTASDGSLSASSSFALEITPVNDAPVAAIALPDQSSAEDEAVSFALPANAFTDVDGDALILSATLAGGAALPDWLVFDAASGSFSGTPPQDFYGALSVTVTASDGSLSASGTFALDITPVNDAPVAADDVAQSPTPVTEDVVTLIDTATLLANDSDVDGDVLAVTAVDATSAHGAALELHTDGTISYDPTNADAVRALERDQTLTDTFTYTIEDGFGEESTATVSIVVHGANEAPVLVDDIVVNNIIGVSEFLVNDFTHNSQTNPSITELANGNFVVTWQSLDRQQGDTSGYAIKAGIFDANGVEIVSEFLVNDFTVGTQWRPSVTALANGHFVVIWESDDGQQGDTSHTAIKARVFDADGAEIVSEFRVNEFSGGSQYAPSVTALANDQFVVTWSSAYGQQGDTSSSAVKARIFDASGDEIVSEFLVNEFTNDSQWIPSVTTLANGNFVVTWSSRDGQQGDTEGAAVKARIFDANGDEIVNEFLVNEFTDGWQWATSVTALANSRFVVTWASDDQQQGDDGWAIKARIFDANGVEVVSEFLVNEFTNNSQVDPSVTALANGHFVVTWESLDGQQGDTSQTAIKARIFDADGNEIVSEFLVNEFTGGSQYAPSVTALANGHFVVTWTSGDQHQHDTSSWAVKARIFDASGVAQTSNLITEDAITLIDAATLLANDSDAEGDAITIAAVSATSTNGAALKLNTDGTIRYDPTGADAVQALTDGQILTDTFTYTVEDSHGGESTATVSVVVQGRNEAPVVAAPAVLMGTDFWDHIIGGPENEELYGLLGNDLLIGGAGDDFLQGDVRGETIGMRLIPDGNGGYIATAVPNSVPGQDTLTGGAGADVFNFVRSFGLDTITDFEVGTDIIRFDANGESDIAFNDVSITETNGNAVVSVPLHMWGSIILEGIGASQLTEDDFMFM
ncbi:tandem-95 repeat protein [Cognatiyoonia sp. IB215182]|uniref:tandem-95 repeat protein n=1 Tax=Cognatiyoonia sp. IB215182 TaxID=3097353 RepID=UPI002A159F32|nr:tandem-95 repeat protein [Cognatiyoonia sp. IB215182]MDX8355418.1 tandem-95 repeat protein [Cognatiyoonia sp. IB215182]